MERIDEHDDSHLDRLAQGRLDLCRECDCHDNTVEDEDYCLEAEEPCRNIVFCPHDRW